MGEDITNEGRIDLTVKLGDKCYIFEFKVLEIDNVQSKALEQIKSKRYWEKYTGKFNEIYLIGVDFSVQKRNVVNFEWEKL
ncbi:MAG: PD-(D/E)XK nuclease domain-containing protein [Candidatus Calescibacterium sp.]|nr:PD-(D/E)XK nuclease domain-containing protein [Candidatus Calescibacterium sp.]